MNIVEEREHDLQRVKGVNQWEDSGTIEEGFLGLEGDSERRSWSAFEGSGERDI